MIAEEHIGVIVVGFILAFVLAIGIGANDVANSFGTSVGAKVLTLKQACVLASVFETLGALFLGTKVSDTLRQGIIDTGPYQNNTQVLMAGNVAALAGSASWLIVCALLRLPVSATHSIVGSTVGFALVSHGVRGIDWFKFGMIIVSWLVSPLLAGIVSTSIFYLTNTFILKRGNPLETGLKVLPGLYAATMIINLFSVFYDGPEMLYLDRIPLWGTFLISFGSGVICAVIVWLFLVPWLRRRILDNPIVPSSSLTERSSTSESLVMSSLSSPGGSSNSSRQSFQLEACSCPPEGPQDGSPVCLDHTSFMSKKNQPKKKTIIDSAGFIVEDALLTTEPRRVTGTKRISIEERKAVNQGHRDNLDSETDDLVYGARARRGIRDKRETAQLFSFLQILTAVFGAFAHGGNDVSNAVAPLVSMWLIATRGEVFEQMATPFWILLYGGLGISVGLCIMGRRVIKTMGEDLTKVTPSSGFCIEIGSAFTVLVANNIGIPISTTHCKVGSVVGVGRLRSRENVDWSILQNIVLAWVITLPVCGGMSAAIMVFLTRLIKS